MPLVCSASNILLLSASQESMNSCGELELYLYELVTKHNMALQIMMMVFRTMTQIFRLKIFNCLLP